MLVRFSSPELENFCLGIVKESSDDNEKFLTRSAKGEIDSIYDTRSRVEFSGNSHTTGNNNASIFICSSFCQGDDGSELSSFSWTREFDCVPYKHLECRKFKEVYEYFPWFLLHVSP